MPLVSAKGSLFQCLGEVCRHEKGAPSRGAPFAYICCSSCGLEHRRAFCPALGSCRFRNPLDEHVRLQCVICGVAPPSRSRFPLSMRWLGGRKGCGRSKMFSTSWKDRLADGCQTACFIRFGPTSAQDLSLVSTNWTVSQRTALPVEKVCTLGSARPLPQTHRQGC